MAYETAPVAVLKLPMALLRRPWTPDQVLKRACNGCGVLLGDVTDEEFDPAFRTGPLPDVTGECPFCSRRG